VRLFSEQDIYAPVAAAPFAIGQELTPSPASVRISFACEPAARSEAITFNAKKRLAASTKPFCQADEDVRKQRLIIAGQRTQQGPAMWDTHWFFRTTEHQVLK
jgi:hypothetical protein